MNKIFIALFSALLFFGMPMEAEAKRLGGGFSLGKSFTTQKKVAPAPSSTQTTAAKPAAPAQQTPKSGMGGLFGGLLAGGLLGALLFGGAFEGIQLMDMLLIGVVLFFLYKMFVARRPQAAYAGGVSSDQAQPAARNTVAAFDAGAAQSAGSFIDTTEVEVPAWFNKEAFLKGAVGHFNTLQRAWDTADWDEIATYTSAELLAQLKTNRAVLPEEQHTEVVSVMADLVNFIEQQDEAIVGIHFYGWIKEGDTSAATEFSEVWHLSKKISDPEASWYIVGIEQSGA